MRCASCNSEISPDDQFCGSCGAKVERVEPVKETPPATCPSCGAPLSPDEQFCGECGHKVTFAGPIENAPPITSPAPKQSRTRIRLKAILIVIVLIIGGIVAISYFKRPEDKQNPQAQYERFIKRLATITPSPEEIAQLKTLEAQAKQEWQEAKLSGKKETASRRAQEYSYYRSTIRFAEGMRNAYIELHAGNYSSNNLHIKNSWRNNKGQLSIMLREYRGLPSPLANKIRRWTQDP